jgi:hypothetical protein
MGELRPGGRRGMVSGGPLEGEPFGVWGCEVWHAWQQVREDKGAPGVGGQSIAAFGERLEGNLCRVWYRMPAGSWMPPPVRAVEVPKAGGPGCSGCQRSLIASRRPWSRTGSGW